MTDDVAHKSKWMIGKVVFGVLFLLGIALSLILLWSVAVVALATVICHYALIMAGRDEFGGQIRRRLHSVERTPPRCAVGLAANDTMSTHILSNRSIKA
jgi:hypothetical protein